MLSFSMEIHNGMNLFDVVGGDMNLLLSAPHAYDHRRPSLSASIKQAEPWTDHMVRVASADLNSHGIVQKTPCSYDPNYHKEDDNPYKRQVRELIKKNKVKYFLDLHGLSDQNNYDVAIYYPIRYMRSRRLADGLASALDRKELKGLTIHIYNFPDRLQESLSEFVAKELGVPGVQIEIARYIREDRDLRDAITKNLIGYLSDIDL